MAERELHLEFRYTALEAMTVCFLQRNSYFRSFKLKISSQVAFQRLSIMMAQSYLRLGQDSLGVRLTEAQMLSTRINLFINRTTIVSRIPKWGFDLLTGTYPFFVRHREPRVFRLRARRLEVLKSSELPLVKDYDSTPDRGLFAGIAAVSKGRMFIAITFQKAFPPNWQVDDLTGTAYLPRRLLIGDGLDDFWALAQPSAIARLL